MFVLQLPVLSQIITDLILDWSECSNAKTRNEAFRTCRSTQLTAGTHFTLTPSTLHLSCVATKDHGLGVLHCRRGLWGARGMQVWGKASSGTFNINLRASSTQKALTLAFFFLPKGHCLCQAHWTAWMSPTASAPVPSQHTAFYAVVFA